MPTAAPTSGPSHAHTDAGPGVESGAETRSDSSSGDPGRWLYSFVAALAGRPRSITGDGVRETLAAVRAALGTLPPEVETRTVEVPSGTPVLDWTVPQEWNARSATLTGPDGRIVADYADDPLHLLGYSVPTRARLPLAELRPHLFSLPDRPDWIPYRTSYYNENWGFCLPDRLLSGLPDGDYEVSIDTSLTDGSLTYLEIILPGSGPDEFLITTHTCHPAMANDNGSGIALAALLTRELAARARRHTFRILFIPGTIGSITWLAGHADVVGRLAGGLVLTGLGDPSVPTYKRSRRGDAPIDVAMARALAETDREHRIVEFSPYGYDERQFCSPGYNLGVGRFGRGQHGEYPEYHTSADNLDFVRPEHLAESHRIVRRAIEICEDNRTWRNTSPYGEPQLGRRGLYRAIGATMNRQAIEMGLLWVLNLADGTNSLLDMADRSGLPFDSLARAADALAGVGLLVDTATEREPAEREPGHGFGAAGTNAAATTTVATDTAATDAAGTDTAGTDTAGTDTAGTDAAARDAAVRATEAVGRTGPDGSRR
jgi:aminopeptidase-like protein